jgi:hypothetical protein
MAKTIPQLTDATTVNAADELIVQQGGITKRATAAELMNNAPVAAISTTTARPLAARFADVVNVKDFGAVGNGVTDDTAAIQHAVDAASFNSVVYFPRGYYKITDTIKITNWQVYLVGEGMMSGILMDHPNKDAIHFEGELTGLKRNISRGGVLNMQINNINISTGTLANPRTGAGIRLTRGSWLTISNVYVQAFPEGIVIDGGQFHTLEQVHIYPMGAGFILEPETAFITFKGNLLDGSYQHCTNHKLVDFTLSAGSPGYSHDYGIKVQSSDGIIISNGNIAHLNKSQVFIYVDTSAGVTPGNTTPYIGALQFSNIYFDAGVAGSSLTCDHNFYVPENTVGSHRRIYSVSINNCTIANASVSSVYAEEPIYDLIIEGCDIQGSASKTIELTNSTVEVGRDNFGKTIISNNAFSFNNYNNDSSGSEIDFGYQANINIIGNSFGSVKECAIRARGSNKNISIIGNTFFNAATTVYSDFVKESGFFVLNPYVVSGNSSESSIPSTRLNGLRVGNKLVSDTFTNDWYEEMTLTPQLLIDGNATGITQFAASSTGFATRIGNFVNFTLRVVLTNKGANVGNVSITGLPYTTNNLGRTACAVALGEIANTITEQIVAELVYDGVSQRDVFLFKIVAGAKVALTDADITNTSDISIAGTYRV